MTQEGDAGVLVRSYLKAMAGLIVLQILNVVSGAVLVRVFPSQESFGQFSLAQQVMGLAGLLVGCGIDGAMVMYLSRERHGPRSVADQRFSTAYRYNLWYGLALTLAIVVAAPWIAQLYKTPALVTVLRVAAPTLFANHMLAVAQGTNVAWGEFGTQAVTTVIHQAATTAAVMAGAVAFATLPAEGAMGTSAVVGVVVAVVVLVHAAHRRRFSLYPFGSWEMLRQMARYGVPLWIGNIFKAYQQSLIVMVTGFVSMVEVGYLSNAWRLAGFVGVVTWGFMIVTVPFIAENPDPQVQHRRTRLDMRFNHYILFPTSAAMAFYARELTGWVYGAEYAHAADYLPVIALGTCASGLARLGSQCLAGFGKTKLTALILILPGAMVLVGGPVLIPRWVWSGPWLFVVGWVIAAVAAIWLLKYYGLGLRFSQDLGRPAAVTAVMFAGAVLGRMAGGWWNPVLAASGLIAGIGLALWLELRVERRQKDQG